MKRVFLTALIVGLLAGTMFAQHMGKDHMARRDFMHEKGSPWMDNDHGNHKGEMHRAMMGIDLTEKQEIALDQLKRDHKIKMIELKSQMAGIHAKGKLLIVDDDVKDSEIKDFASKISKFSGEMVVERMSHSRKVRGLLNEEQRLRFDNNILSHSSAKQMKQKHMRHRIRERHSKRGHGE